MNQKVFVVKWGGMYWYAPQVWKSDRRLARRWDNAAEALAEVADDAARAVRLVPKRSAVPS